MLTEKIYQLRRQKGYSQEQLADVIGVSRQTISKWEGGVSTPELDKLIALADCFEVTVDELVRDAKPAPQEQPSAAGEPAAKPAASGMPQSWVGLGLCVLGLIGLAVTGFVWITDPASIAIINESSALTINGSGLIFTICALAIVAGIYLLLKRSDT